MPNLLPVSSLMSLQRRIAGLASLPRRLAPADGGNVTVIFALVLLPMIGMIGLGIDIARSLAAKTTLQGAIDSAVLAAANETEAILQTNGNTTVAQYAGTLAGQQVFAANITKVARWLGSTPSPSIQVNPGAASITVVGSFSTPVPTVFGKMFGVKTFAVAGRASASLTLPKYLNISVVVDISQSMGLASTTTGQTQLSSLTGGCAFGCHVYGNGQNGTVPYEQVAHTANPPIQLRIDVIRQATQNMIQTAQQLATSTPYISFGLYTLQGGNGQTDGYGKTASGQPLATLARPSSNYASLYAAAGTLDLGANNSNGIGDTDYVDAMTALASTVPASGSGTSSSPQQFVFLLTDGVQDVYVNNNRSNCPAGTVGFNGTHCTMAFNPATCAALKNNNVTIGVIYTTYLAIPGEASYQTLVAPFASQLAPNLQSCASPGYFYQATDANDIQVAINALFASATGHGILTQ